MALYLKNASTKSNRAWLTGFLALKFPLNPTRKKYRKKASSALSYFIIHSVGYGASFKGLAALLGMLNSCASGVTVVNIDNGFGAGVAASKINRIRVG